MGGRNVKTVKKRLAGIEHTPIPLATQPIRLEVNTEIKGETITCRKLYDLLKAVPGGHFQSVTQPARDADVVRVLLLFAGRERTLSLCRCLRMLGAYVEASGRASSAKPR